jgi:HlyD family type I secretion membrane fusion protein
MKLDLTPMRTGYVEPTFGTEDRRPLDPRLEQRLRRPMIVGGAVIGIFVVLLAIIFSLVPLATSVNAPATVQAETNRKTMRAREGGTVRQILVREGQRVRAQQPLLLLNDVEARAAFDVYQNQYDVLLAQNARFSAEATGRSALQFPPELTARMGDPRVASLVRDQEFLFTTRTSLFQSQSAVLGQRIEQLESQVTGLQAQVASVDEQRRLTDEELAGYRKLNEQGYAPKTLILRYERTLAELNGRKGQLMADIARMRQQMGETRLQLVSLRNERASQAAEGLRDTQSRLADVIPRLTTARQTLGATVVRSPVDGFVFSLTQFTPGGVVGAGEVLMEVVPATTPLTVTAMVKPEDIDQVYQGQKAKVQLTGLNPRFNDQLDARVSLRSADRNVDEKTGMAFYRVQLTIPPTELKKLKKGVELTPGMPAMANIVTGERTIMEYLISPITQTWQDAFREE